MITVFFCFLECPGINFFETIVKKTINSSGAQISNLVDIGICISIPEGALKPEEEPLDLVICPCFSGHFELPLDYESASPAFLIHPSRRVDIQKEVTVKIHHHASLQSEEDCEDMVFLSASSTPEYRESHPVYTFKKICGTKTAFRPGDQVGEIALRHFCLIKSAKRKRKREEDAFESTRAPKQHKGMSLTLDASPSLLLLLAWGVILML